MKQNLNDIYGRIAAAKIEAWKKSLADRWRFDLLNDLKEIEDALCLIRSNAP